MDVDEPAVEAAHESGTEDAHEAGEGDDVGTVPLDRLGERGVERVACRERAVVDDLDGDAALPREGETGGIGAVAHDGGDPCVPALCLARAHDRLHVRAAAGDEDDDVLHRRRSVSAAHRCKPTIGRFADPLSR
jgi:hypothetical protein